MSNLSLYRAPLQLKVFSSILKKKLGQSHNGFVYGNQEKGKPIRLMKVSQPQAGSSTASESTLKKRSQVLEHLTESISAPTKSLEDIVCQEATTIRRNKKQFLESAAQSGLKITSSFTLKQVCSHCTLSSWAFIFRDRGRPAIHLKHKITGNQLGYLTFL